MSDDFDDDFKWQMKFAPRVKSIVGPFLLRDATFEEDANEGTDLIVFSADRLRIGCRIRRPKWLKSRFRYEFTIRSWRKSGAVTEHEKFSAGWCDWFFYGFAQAVDKGFLARWCLVDLHAWRHHTAAGTYNRPIRQQINGDGETGFIPFDVRAFDNPPPILIASSWEDHAQIMNGRRPLPRNERSTVRAPDNGRIQSRATVPTSDPRPWRQGLKATHEDR